MRTARSEIRFCVHCVVFLLFNTRKHDVQSGDVGPGVFDSLDDMSSAPWFTGWDPSNRPSDSLLAKCREPWPGDPPIHRTTMWLANVGWRRAGGPIRFDEVPHLPM